MAADSRISIANRLKSVPMGFFNDNSLGQISGVCTTVIGSIESMVPMVLVNILGGLITTAVFFLVTYLPTDAPLLTYKNGWILWAVAGVLYAALITVLKQLCGKR